MRSVVLLPAGSSLPLAVRWRGGWPMSSMAASDGIALGCLEQTGAQREES